MPDVSLLVTLPENVVPSFSVTVAIESDVGAFVLLQPDRTRIIAKTAADIFRYIFPPIASLLPDRAVEAGMNTPIFGDQPATTGLRLRNNQAVERIPRPGFIPGRLHDFEKRHRANSDVKIAQKNISDFSRSDSEAADLVEKTRFE
jgi:hypothetical protein